MWSIWRVIPRNRRGEKNDTGKEEQWKLCVVELVPTMGKADLRLAGDPLMKRVERAPELSH